MTVSAPQMRPIWQNDDGTLKERVPYWIIEDFYQWRRGDHHAHVDLFQSIAVAKASREFHYIRSLQKRESRLNQQEHEIMCSLLPAHMQNDLIKGQTIPKTNGKSFVVQLRREFPEIEGKFADE